MKRWVAWLALLWTTTGVAHAEWYEASGRNVRVVTEGKAESARALAEQLERFDAGLRALRGLKASDPGPANRLTVYLLDNVAAIEKLSGGRNIAGFYVPRAGGSVAFSPRSSGTGGQADLSAQQVLLHEYTHHFMYRNFNAAFPVWFVEGFAEFHATAKFAEDGAVHFGAPAQYRAYGLFNGPRMPMEKLFEATTANKRASAIDATYGRGWLLTHYLTFNAARRKQLGDYLSALNRGQANVEAGKAAFGDLGSSIRSCSVIWASGWRSCACHPIN